MTDPSTPFHGPTPEFTEAMEERSKLLEPGAQAQADYARQNLLLASIAISLKRIADQLEWVTGRLRAPD